MVTQMTVAPEGLYIALDKIRDDLDQVRRDWGYDGGKDRLQELVESIRLHGVLQAIEVSPRPGGLYDVLIGHRRFDAARKAGLREIPAVVRRATNDERIVLQLVENLLRADVSPVDEGEAYKSLIDNYRYTIATLSTKFGKSLPYISARLRILDDNVLRKAVNDGLIAPSVAYGITMLAAPYDQPLRLRLQAGDKVVPKDILDAREHQAANGAVNPRNASSRLPRWNRQDLRRETDARRRRILDMRDNKGMTYSDIARVFGLDPKTVLGNYKEAKARGLDPNNEPVDAKAALDDGFNRLDQLVSVHHSDLIITVDDPSRLVVRVESVMTPTLPPPTPNAVRSPLPYYAPDAPQKPQERSASMEITAYHQPLRPAEVTWCDLCRPFAGAAFERTLSWAASRGMTAVDMLEQYRAQCR